MERTIKSFLRVEECHDTSMISCGEGRDEGEESRDTFKVQQGLQNGNAGSATRRATDVTILAWNDPGLTALGLAAGTTHRRDLEKVRDLVPDSEEHG